MLAPVFAVPLNGPFEPLPKRGPSPKAEFLPGPARIQRPPRLPVRLAGVPHDPAPKPGELGNELDQRFDGNLEPCSDVHRAWPVISVRGQNNRLSTVLHIEKL